MKALITGATGFIGSHLAEQLSSQGVETCALMRASSHPRNLGSTRFQRVEGDLLDPNSLRKAVKGMDVVFHLAGVVTGPNRNYFFMHNARGTQALAEAVARENPQLKRFVYVSSLAAGGPSESQLPRVETQQDQPVSAYGESKLQGEKELLAFKGDFPVSIVRPPIVYGPRDRGVFVFVQSVVRRVAPVIAGSGKDRQKYYSIVHVDDLCRGIISAAGTKGQSIPSGERYYISGNIAVTYEEIISTISSHLKVSPLKVRVPQFALRGAAMGVTLVSRVTGKSFPLNMDKLNEITPDYWVCSNDKAKRELGFSPEKEFFSGMGETIAWYKKHKWI